MEKSKLLVDLIKNGVVVICHSKDEVTKLGEMVDCIFYGYGQQISRYAYRFGQDGFEVEMAIRLEQSALNGLFDYGYDKPNYYRRYGYRLVDFSDINLDFGELESNEGDLWSFIFG